MGPLARLLLGHSHQRYVHKASPARSTNHLEGNLTAPAVRSGQTGRENVAIQHPCRSPAPDATARLPVSRRYTAQPRKTLGELSASAVVRVSCLLIFLLAVAASWAWALLKWDRKRPSAHADLLSNPLAARDVQ